MRWPNPRTDPARPAAGSPGPGLARLHYGSSGDAGLLLAFYRVGVLLSRPNLRRVGTLTRSTAGDPAASRGGPSPGAGQLVQLALGPVPLVAVSGLQPPDDLISPAGGLVQVVVGQVAPLLLDLPLELLPIALDA